MTFTHRLIRWVSTSLGTLVGGIYLFALYACTFWLVVGSLSAIQVRDNIEDSSLPFTFNNTADAENLLLRAQERIYANLENKDLLSQMQSEQYARFNAIVDAFAEPGDINDPAMLWDREQAPAFLRAEERCPPLPVGAPGDDLVPPPEAEPGCGSLYEYRSLGREITALLDSGFLESIAETETAALAQFQQFKSLSDFVDVNRFFQRLHFTSFLTAPREILVMLLTIIMGVLGSVITMTWTFVRRDAGLSVRRFLLLPFVGGMSAFIVLIFLKAGQLTLTAGETTDELSPFVLSFVGIISGLLSERAYGRISEVGQNFFRVDARQDRWGIRLDEALAAAGVSVEEVARHLDLDDLDAAELVEGKAAADPVQQQLIAALVRSEPRVLFTDIPPAAVPRNQPAPAVSDALPVTP